MSSLIQRLVWIPGMGRSHHALLRPRITGVRRADAARAYRIDLGIDPDRMTTISYGEERPAVQGSNEAAWSQNRRDEFIPLGG